MAVAVAVEAPEGDAAGDAEGPVEHELSGNIHQSSTLKTWPVKMATAVRSLIPMVTNEDELSISFCSSTRSISFSFFFLFFLSSSPTPSPASTTLG